MLLNNKKILITGLLSNRSIAYGIAKAAKSAGATLAFTYQNDRFKERITDLAAEFDSTLVYPCDVSIDEEIKTLFQNLGNEWGKIDGIVHAIAFAPREAIAGDFLEGCDRESFRVAHDVSAYSFVALAKEAREYLNDNSALVTLTYLGAEKVVPNYNTMGLAKASLEANVRYLAAALGTEGTRVNAISAGPIRTLAAAGISDFRSMLAYVAEKTPLKRNVTIEEVGNAAAFLCSDLASGVTGDILYVDTGYHILGMA